MFFECFINSKVLIFFLRHSVIRFLTTTFTIHTLFQMLKYFSKYGFDFAEIFAIVKKLRCVIEITE